MADTYGVTTADVAVNLPALYPAGDFPAAGAGVKAPTKEQVAGWITAADAVVALKVIRLTAASPAQSDRAAAVARQYILQWVIAQVVGSIYAGNDPEKVAAAQGPYFNAARDLLKTLEAMDKQAAGDGAAPSRVLGVDGSLVRDLVIDDTDLGGLAGVLPAEPRRRRF